MDQTRSKSLLCGPAQCTQNPWLASPPQSSELREKFQFNSSSLKSTYFWSYRFFAVLNTFFRRIYCHLAFEPVSSESIPIYDNLHCSLESLSVSSLAALSQNDLVLCNCTKLPKVNNKQATSRNSLVPRALLRCLCLRGGVPVMVIQIGGVS